MKKYLKNILCVCLCLTLAAGGAAGAIAATLGDVNSDDSVTAEDARGILRAAVGLDTLDAEAAAKADMDCDGEITAADARLALRTAVGLNLTVDEVYKNQYDILCSGRYYMELNVSDADDIKISCTVDGNKKYISTKMPMPGTAPMDFAFCTEGSDLWFVDEKHEVYTKLDEESMEFLGSDAGFLDEFSEITDQIGVFGDLRPLNEADFSQNDNFAGVPCVSYWFMNEDGTAKVYIDGVKLLGLVRVDRQGRTIAVAEFGAVNAVLPANAFQFTENYTKVSDVFSFMMIAFGEALGGDMVSPEDIQQLIDEAKAQANNG